MGYWQHDRTYDHRETEDCNTVVLSADIGRYSAGTLLCDVLEDLIQRTANLSADYAHGFSIFGLNAFIAPYNPGTLGGSLLSILGIDAFIKAAQTGSFGIDAEMVAPTPVERSASFGIWAYIHEADAPTAQLATPIDADDTVIVVTNFADFPSVCPFLIEIDGETMLVTDGCGTDTWTVIRGYNGTTATPHAGGATVVAC